MTMPEPLSALLITRVWSEASSLRASFCLGVKLGVLFRGCSEFVSFLTLSRYSSISTEAVGGVHVLFSLKGCGSVGDLFWKKYLILLFLSNSSRDSSSWACGLDPLGTKVKPRERTSKCEGLKVFEERLVMYFCLFNSLWTSFFVCFCFFWFCILMYFYWILSRNIIC